VEGSNHTSSARDQDDPPEDDESERESLGQDHELTEGDKDPDQSSGLEPIDEALRPLTDQEYAEHVSEVRDRLTKAHDQGLATEFLHTIDPDHLRWTRERRQTHSEITETIYARAAEVPCDGKAIIAGGLGGAGKTTTLRQEADVDLSKYLMINPDDIKEEMARRNLVPEVEGLSPMEATDLVHEESSAIAKQLARRAYTDGKNVIWDITMSSTESTEKRVNDLRQSGYAMIRGIFVDISVEVSVARSQSRHREGHEDFRAGRGLGGRFVPSEVIRSQADSVWGSQNRKIFESLKHKFDAWTRYDNSVDGHRALLVESSARRKADEERRS
jgi:predicted ABC-type ATPase